MIRQRQRNADPMTKQLFALAAWALLFTCLMGLAASWHTNSYTVAPPTTIGGSRRGSLINATSNTLPTDYPQTRNRRVVQ